MFAAATRYRQRWIVVAEGNVGRYGGELRRRQIFRQLAARTDARVLDQGRSPRVLREAARGQLGWLPGPLLYRLPRFGPRPKLAASERLRQRMLETADEICDPVVVAIYDHAVAQSRALGVRVRSEVLAEFAERQHRNIETFRWLVVPTRSFAELAELPMDRVIVGGNGTDTARVRPGPWPALPTVGMVSGAAPGRGIELLIDAVRLARTELPDLTLRLWLVETSDESAAYLRELRSSCREPWVVFGRATYDDLGDALSTATMLAIPHPPNPYMDVALPVKLFDTMAAGRPLVVTPRAETRSIVEGLRVGQAAAGDTSADLAGAMLNMLRDEPELHAMGERARTAAVERYDWRIVGDAIADAVLAREDGSGPSPPSDA
jgi:glycosyltransferase involved in cell wall biosynthesis